MSDATDPEQSAKITLFPLLGYATHTLPGELVMVTLELPLDAAAPEAARQLLRIGLRAKAQGNCSRACGLPPGLPKWARQPRRKAARLPRRKLRSAEARGLPRCHGIEISTKGQRKVRAIMAQIGPPAVFPPLSLL